MPDEQWLREQLTSDQRTADLGLTIDPGFIHHRKIETVVGPRGMKFVDEAIRDLPDLPDYMRRVRIDHIYTEAIVKLCAVVGIPSLPSLVAAGKGTMFCSTIELAPSPDLYEAERVRSVVALAGVDEPRVALEYSTDKIVADTMRPELRNGGSVAVVAQLSAYRDGELVFHPLVMGSPWLTNPDGAVVSFGIEWFAYDYFEIFIEDIDEFSAVREVEAPSDFALMERISEDAFKTCLAEILGDQTRKDWGGETSDHYAAHIHLDGKRTTAAFLLKGPARFSPMGLNHLGKNNDQIFRLAQEPAQVLIVQHAHEITSPVRATIRAFAVQPGAARRYCLIDGRDSLRLLTAYGMVDDALAITTKMQRFP